MKLNVLSVAYPFAPVRPDTAGGAEQVLGMIDEALTRLGHRSEVIACEGSVVSGTLVKTPGVHGSIDPLVSDFIEEQHKIAIEQSLKRWDIDLIHMHGIDFSSYLPQTDVPVLVTLHLPVSWYPEEVLCAAGPGVFFNCVSASQFESCPAMPSLTTYINNGIQLENYDIRVGKHNYALSLGRICWEKGYHVSLDAAKMADIPLIIAGELFPYEYHREYYYREIQPRLDGKSYRFIGPVGPEKKKRLIAAARCVLIPSLVPETSSLVAMEALACGTPVIAFPSGALSEIVENGRTGFLVNSKEEMAEAIKRAEEIDPEVCRQTARERFSSEKMIGSYISLYNSILGNSPLLHSIDKAGKKYANR
ncbi:MAG: glycosyltransferase family 4 protein [Ignavibacteriales bacterium]